LLNRRSRSDPDQRCDGVSRDAKCLRSLLDTNPRTSSLEQGWFFVGLFFLIVIVCYVILGGSNFQWFSRSY